MYHRGHWGHAICILEDLADLESILKCQLSMELGCGNSFDLYFNESFEIQASYAQNPADFINFQSKVSHLKSTLYEVSQCKWRTFFTLVFTFLN